MDAEEAAVEAFLARHEEARVKKIAAERALDQARAARRVNENPIFRPTLLERIGLGSFSVRVQREMRQLSTAA